MPQPLKVGSTVTQGPDLVLQKPDLAAQIGNVCANWNLVEKELMFLYAMLMGDYLPSRPGFSPPSHPVAFQVFDSLNSFNPRIELLEKLLTWRASKDQSKRFNDFIRPQLRKRFAERSIIAHGSWGICQDQPDALILLPTYGDQMIWKKRDFEAVSRRIVDLRKSVGEMSNELYKSRLRRA